jgi:DNA-binding CsgD family transcriptional regulator
VRQRALRATIDWSYQLLDPVVQTLFARLGVFVGGWTLEAAEAICGPNNDRPIDVLSGIEALVDQSHVYRREGDTRFGMMEAIREYAAERLEASDETTNLRRRHAEFMLELAEQAAPALHGPQQTLWLDRLEREHENLQTALTWAVENREHDVGLRLATALGRSWEVGGHRSESIGSVAVSLSLAERTAEQDAMSAAESSRGTESFAAAQAGGRTMVHDQRLGHVIDYARADDDDTVPDLAQRRPTARAKLPRAVAQSDRLTRREREVATLVARGLTDRKVAAKLVITPGTVGVHLDHIYGKLGIRSRAQLGAWAARQQIESEQPA